MAFKFCIYYFQVKNTCKGGRTQAEKQEEKKLSVIGV
jgi:hypothetical protein